MIIIGCNCFGFFFFIFAFICFWYYIPFGIIFINSLWNKVISIRCSFACWKIWIFLILILTACYISVFFGLRDDIIVFIVLDTGDRKCFFFFLVCFQKFHQSGSIQLLIIHFRFDLSYKIFIYPAILFSVFSSIIITVTAFNSIGIRLFQDLSCILVKTHGILCCFGSVCLVRRYRRCSISIRKLLVFSIRTDKSFCFFSCISNLVPVLLCIDDLAHLPITSISICLIHRSCFSAVFVRNIRKFPFSIWINNLCSICKIDLL